MSSTAQTTPCRFLDLSAELRNMIYRFTLCSKDEVVVPRTGLEQPALIRTCRQIRQEATAIYYLENVFNITAPGFERFSCQNLERQARTHINTAKLDYLIDDIDDADRSWTELMKWLKAYHEGKTDIWYLSEKYLEEGDKWYPADSYYVACKASDIVKKLKGSVQWSMIADVLHSYKEGTMENVEWVE